MKFRLLSLGVAIAAASSQALAGAPSFLDSRAFAMGGVGVASARPAAASYYNPAMLAVKQQSKSDGFGLILPSVYAAVSDQDELIDEVDGFEEDYLDPFEEVLDELNDATGISTGSDLAAARALGNRFISAANDINGKLVELNQDKLIVDVGLGLSVQIPSESLAFGFFATGSAKIGATLQYRDAALMDDYISQVSDIVALDNTNTPDEIVTAFRNLDLTYQESDPDNDISGTLQSSVRAVGIGVGQVGVSLASQFEVGGYDLAVGVSPKMVSLTAYDLVADVDDFEADDLEDSKTDDSSFNLDLGLATYLDEQDHWLVGLSIENLLSQEIKTKGATIAANHLNAAEDLGGVTIELKPTITAGISYNGLSYVIAADVELTKTDAVSDLRGNDLIPASQIVAIGAEYDLFETVQFRLGARHNLEGDPDTLLTTGFGFTVFGASLELAAMGNSNTLGASFQIGSTF